MKNFPYKNTLIFTMAIALFLSVNEYRKSANLAESQTAALVDKTKHFESEIGTITASKKVLQLEKKNLKELVYSKDDTLNTLRKEFSKVKSIIQTRTITKIDTVSIPFEVHVPCEFERKGKHKEAWFEFDYNVNQNGLNFSDFNMPNEQTSITGFKRSWFWGKQTYTTDITNTNPHIKTIEVQTIEVIVPKRFYDTRLFNIGLGVIGGFLLAK